MDLRSIVIVGLVSWPCACAGGEQGSASTTSEVTTSEATSVTEGSTSTTGQETEPTATFGTTSGMTTAGGPDECVLDSDCREGLLCEEGKCVFCAEGAFDPGRSADMRAERAFRCFCGEASIEVPVLAPNVVLIADRSVSMASEVVDHDGDANTPEVSRWAMLHGAIEALATEHETHINIGLQLLPGEAATNTYDVGACVTSVSPEIPAAPENLTTILATMPAASVMMLSGATPTRAALESARNHLLMLDNDRDRALVLFTDGAANCDPESVDEAERFELLDAGALAAVADAQTEGIATYVIGVDAADEVAPAAVDSQPDGVNPSEHLAELALAGGAHPFVNASDQAALDGAVAEVVSALLPCVVDIEPPPQWPEEVTLEVGDVDYGTALGGPCGGEDGWRFVDAKAEQVELCGATCFDARLAGGVVLQYTCPSSG